MFVGVCDPIVTWGLGSWRAEVPRPILVLCRPVAVAVARCRVAHAVAFRAPMVSPTGAGRVSGRRLAVASIAAPCVARAVVRAIPPPAQGHAVAALVAGCMVAVRAWVGPAARLPVAPPAGGNVSTTTIRGGRALVPSLRMVARIQTERGCPCPTI